MPKIFKENNFILHRWNIHICSIFYYNTSGRNLLECILNYTFIYRKMIVWDHCNVSKMVNWPNHKEIFEVKKRLVIDLQCYPTIDYPFLWFALVASQHPNVLMNMEKGSMYRISYNQKCTRLIKENNVRGNKNLLRMAYISWLLLAWLHGLLLLPDKLEVCLLIGLLHKNAHSHAHTKK